MELRLKPRIVGSFVQSDMLLSGSIPRTLLSLILLAIPTTSLWPFPPKRFTGNSLMGAGPMGLDDDGRVVAFGDFDADQL